MLLLLQLRSSFLAPVLTKRRSRRFHRAFSRRRTDPRRFFLAGFTVLFSEDRLRVLTGETDRQNPSPKTPGA
jgi:hypothetical protein